MQDIYIQTYHSDNVEKQRERKNESSKGRGHILYKGAPVKLRTSFTRETMDARKQWDNALKGLKEKIKLSSNYLIAGKTIIQKGRQNNVIPL